MNLAASQAAQVLWYLMGPSLHLGGFCSMEQEHGLNQNTTDANGKPFLKNTKNLIMMTKKVLSNLNP